MSDKWSIHGNYIGKQVEKYSFFYCICSREFWGNCIGHGVLDQKLEIFATVSPIKVMFTWRSEAVTKNQYFHEVTYAACMHWVNNSLSKFGNADWDSWATTDQNVIQMFTILACRKGCKWELYCSYSRKDGTEQNIWGRKASTFSINTGRTGMHQTLLFIKTDRFLSKRFVNNMEIDWLS